MKKIASVLLLFACFLSCKKKQNQETLILTDTLVNKGIVAEQKEYFLVRRIGKKDFPKGKSFKIDGILKDENTKADFKNLELVLQDSSNKVIRRATVKSDGKFTFYKVETGDYKIGLDSATIMATADRIRITKTEDFIKDDIHDKFDLGKTLNLSEVNDRFLAEVYRDSLVSKNAAKITGKIFHTANKALPKLVTYILLDGKNKIIRKVEWSTKEALAFSKLTPNNYKILVLDPVPGAKMKVSYIANEQKEIAKIDNLKVGDKVKEQEIVKYTSYRFKADTLDGGKFAGLLIKEGEVAGETKIMLTSGANKIEHEILTSQTGTFYFENLNPSTEYNIVIPSTEKGYQVKHTNPVHKMDELDTLELQLMKQRTMQEVLSQGIGPEKFEQSKVLKCLQRIDQKLIENPNDADLHFKRGVMYFELEDYNTAIEEFNKTTQLKPDFGAAYMYRADSRDYMGDFEGAVQDYTKNLQYHPDNLVANYKRGVVRKDIGQAKEAVDDLTKVILSYPEYHYPYFYRGLARYQISKYADAIQDYNKALVLQPNLQEAYFNKGLAYMQQKKYIDATMNFNKAIEMNPNDADAYLVRGQVKSINGKPEEANRDFDEAIRIDPNLEVAYYEKANMRFTLGDEEGARRMYDEAVQKFNSVYEPYYQRGVFYYNIRDYKAAYEDLTKAASIYDKDPYVFYYKALVNKKLKNKSQICDDARKALDLGYVDSNQEMGSFVDKYCK